ncbi:MAG: hypothetical protein G01um101416_49 [Microgenomates group bacterium Gr01-1014_16]|nr:MAG: hypothetical protein G01um101416_49 [Microgenomates group bacterium Gr01-1014_16]
MAKPKIVNEWIKLADEDYGFACSNLSDPDAIYFGFICFHFQQSAEKYFKAYIVAKSLEFTKIHDLDSLCQICLADNPKFDELKDECLFLNDFYVATRYPVTVPPSFSRVEAQQAKTAVEKISKLVKTFLVDPKNSDISKAAGIIIVDRKLLVEKDFDKEFYIAPGGKLDPGETPKQALVRELKEEFLIDVSENDLEEFGSFSAPSSGQEHRTIHMYCFIVKKCWGEISLGHKVEKLLWLTSQIPDGIKVGSIFEHEVIPRLKAQNLID